MFTTYEVRKGRPRLEKLRRLLEEHPFKGEEFEVEYNDTEEESGMVTGGKNTAIKKASMSVCVSSETRYTITHLHHWLNWVIHVTTCLLFHYR